MKVIVSVSRGVAEVAHRPDEVEVVIVDFDGHATVSRLEAAEWTPYGERMR